MRKKILLIWILAIIILCSFVFASTTVTQTMTQDSSASVIIPYGAKFRTNSTNIILEKAGRFSTTNVTRARLYKDDDTSIENSTTLVGDNFTFDSQLETNTVYYILMDASGGSYIYQRSNGAIPFTTENITWIDGVFNEPHPTLHGGYIGNLRTLTYISIIEISIIYPTNLTYNDFNGFINVSLNRNGTVLLNDSRFPLYFNNETFYSFYNSSSLEEGQYSINVSANGSSEILNFWIDLTKPGINSILENNNTYVTINKSYQINYTDNILLWGFNISIDGTQIYNISNINTQYYSYNGSINGSAYSLGIHNLTTIVWDAHTKNKLTQEWKKPKKTDNKKDFDGLYIKSKDKANYITYEEKIDRKSFCFEYIKNKKEMEFTLPDRLVSIDNPLYPGWFVDPVLMRWIDFSGEDEIKKIGNKVIAITKDPKKKFCFNSVGELNSNNARYLWYNMARLNITAYNYTGGTILDFDVYLNGSLHGSTTNGYYSLDNVTEGDYSIKIDNPIYELIEETVTITEIYQEYNQTLYPTNSINITILDENTGNPIIANITMQFSNILIGGFTNITDTGSFFVDNLDTGEWGILFTGDDYSPKTYYVTVANRSHSYLTAYLSQNYSTTIFTVTNKDTSELLDGVSATMYRIIGGNWTVVGSKLTDISGKIEFAYQENINYRFFFSNTGYDNYIFTLTPILFSEYDVKMQSTTTQVYYPDYDRVSIAYYPTIFFNDDITNFTFLIQSPYGELLTYGYNSTYPGGTTAQEGIQAIGEMFNSNFNITGATFGDVLTLNYWYQSSIYGYRNFTQIYTIVFEGTNTTTMMSNREKTYGLGLFERLLFVVFFVLLVVGIASLVGRVLEGMAFGLFLFGVFVYMGFIPLWSVLISIFIGIMLISSKGGN